jgi:rubredoxin
LRRVFLIILSLILTFTFTISEATMTNPAPDAPEAATESPSSPATTPPPPDRYECRACGYVYEPDRGDGSNGVAPGTAFTELPDDWRCPVCGARQARFDNIGPIGKASGFEENLKYGLGVNSLTPGAKNLLIFGAMAIAIAFMLSLYGLR